MSFDNTRASVMTVHAFNQEEEEEKEEKGGKG